ncbi:MAG: hypothetical protein EHM79_03935 [Geobacter sp.]|nr:MAG: hypothetical protein EHM79_03935 [Geobacter sp.]
MLATIPRHFLWRWALVPALCLMVLLVATKSSRADEGAAEAPTAESELPQEPGFFDVWGKKIEATHESIERYILEKSVKVDDFFGSENAPGEKPTRYQLRWRNSLRIEHDGTVKFGPSVRLNLALSKINDRFRLIIAGEDEPEPATQSLPRDPGSPGFDRTTPNTHFVNTELRYDLVRTPALKFFLGAGVQVKLPFEAFARSRLDYLHTFNDTTIVRFGETVFVKNSDLLGETTEITLEKLLDRGTILRWSNAGTASQEIRGLEWGSELSLIRELSARSAVTVTGGAYGNTSSSTIGNNYRLFALYRQNFLRSWLFYELEPELFWHRTDRNPDAPTFAFTFRLEIVFKGSSLGRPAL